VLHHFLILQFKTERELTPRKVVHGFVSQKKSYPKRKKIFHEVTETPSEPQRIRLRHKTGKSIILITGKIFPQNVILPAP
jgi:hypothetical protein